MRNPLDPLANVMVERGRRTDRMLVTHDRRHWWAVMVLDVGMFVLAVLAWTTWPVTHNWGWLGVAAGVVIGLQLGRTSLVGARRALAYRSGWLAGRTAFVAAMSEAQRRGMSPGEWLSAELARDFAVLGLDPTDLPPPFDG